MRLRLFVLCTAVIAGLAFVGSLAGLQARGQAGHGILWMIGAGAALALIVLRIGARRPVFVSPLWLAVAAFCCVIGLLLVFVLPPLAGLGGAVVAIGLAVVLLKLTTATRPEER